MISMAAFSIAAPMPFWIKPCFAFVLAADNLIIPKASIKLLPNGNLRVIPLILKLSIAL